MVSLSPAVKAPRISILAAGTELTTGQITNRNASWLAEKLVDLGGEVVLHETVADDHAMIGSALDRCLAVSSLIFVTGGLGPTTDDFTRNVISAWAGKPLKYDEPSWNHIVGRLGRLGITVAESNRQQCFFPEGATVLPNPEGTANGFTLEAKGATLWILPGPPREVAALWTLGIEAQVRGRIPVARPLKLLTWQCMGKSEAELGELVEKALAGSGLQIGYRAHRPYVEIKVWCPEENIQANARWFAALETAIGPWILTRQGADLALLLLKQLMRAEEIEIVDCGTGGILAERLGVALAQLPETTEEQDYSLITEWNTPQEPGEWVKEALAQADPEAVTLVVTGFNKAGKWAIGIRDGAILRSEEIQAPWNRKELLDRMRRYACEHALKRWCDWLAESVQ